MPEVAITVAEIKALHAEAQRVMEEAKRIATVFQSAKPPKRLSDGLAKAYMDAVKGSHGITSARPSCLVAMQNAEKNMTTVTLTAAVTALTKHADDVKKENAAKPAEKAKVSAFAGAIYKIIAGTKKYLA